MRLEQLTQLVEIVNCGSINKAAEKLYMSPSALTSSIKSLEIELGDQLLHRSNKGIKITKYGAEVYNRGKKICAEVSALKLDALAPAPKEHLHILNNYSLKTRDAFLKTYRKCSDSAGIIMRFKDCSFLQTISEISLGLSQIGVVTIYPQISNMQMKLIKKHHLEYQKLYDTEMFVFLGPKNPFYTLASDTISLKQLWSYDFISYLDEDSNSFWQDVFIDNEYKKLKIFVNSAEMMMELINQTQAYTIEVYGSKLFQQSAYFHQIRLFKIQDADTTCEYGIVKPQASNLSSLEQLFLSQLKEEFE